MDFKAPDVTNSYVENIHRDPAQVRVSEICTAHCSLASYNRRDYYKITLNLAGNSLLHYANRGIKIDKPALVFTNPLVPYSWEGNHEAAAGYFCVFTNEFLRGNGRLDSLDESSLFKPGGDPVYFLTDQQSCYINSIFTRMKQELDGE